MGSVLPACVILPLNIRFYFQEKQCVITSFKVNKSLVNVSIFFIKSSHTRLLLLFVAAETLCVDSSDEETSDTAKDGELPFLKPRKPS